MNMLKLMLISVLLISFSAMSRTPDEDCESIPLPARELVKTLKAVTEGLYKDVATMEVDHDGKGKLSIYYENGVPKLLKMTYANKKGETIGQKSFDELEQGKPLNYMSSDKDYPGKAIILEKGATFKNGSRYSLILKVRSSVNPDKYTSHPIEFDSDMSAPKLINAGKPFKHIAISPGISWMAWDGTFDGVKFK